MQRDKDPKTVTEEQLRENTRRQEREELLEEMFKLVEEMPANKALIDERRS